jgi:hypothetical protein
MALTFHDLVDLLKREDEVTLLEVLEISSEDLIERFGDWIEERYEELTEKYQDEVFGTEDDEDDSRGADWS